jgi:Leucine-rich repeat (LRR) protein
LTFLSLAGNKVNDISALAGLTNLRSLNLRDCQVSDIGVLSELTDLIELDLFHDIDKNNRIDDISALANLNNLMFLNLGGNQINDVSALARLVNLTNLALTDNQISDINVLAGFTKLLNLDLRSNPISTEQIENLREALPDSMIKFEHNDNDFIIIPSSVPVNEEFDINSAEIFYPEYGINSSGQTFGSSSIPTEVLLKAYRLKPVILNLSH